MKYPYQPSPIYEPAAFVIDESTAAWIIRRHWLDSDKDIPEDLLERISDETEFAETIKNLDTHLVAYGSFSVFSAYEILLDDGIFAVLCDGFTGSVSPIYDPSMTIDQTVSVEYEDDRIALIISEKKPGLFYAAYDNLEELTEEFRNKLRSYFPADFDYKNHIASVTGIYSE